MTAVTGFALSNNSPPAALSGLVAAIGAQALEQHKVPKASG